MSGLSGLSQLQNLHLPRCARLINLSSLVNVPRLSTLDLSDCENLVDISSLQGFLQLSTLNLSHCYKVTDIDVLLTMRHLQYSGMTLLMLASERGKNATVKKLLKEGGILMMRIKPTKTDTLH